jgi:ADP-ribose pyrophosphatase
MDKWEVLDSQMVFDQPWYKLRRDVVRLPNGRVMEDYLVAVQKDFVITVPVLPNSSVLVLSQYKHGIGKVIAEFPGGLPEENETTEDSAKRELLEETGHSASVLTKLATLAENPTKSTGWMHIYLATGLEQTAGQMLDGTGEVEVGVKRVALDQLWPMVHSGVFESAPMVAAATYACIAMNTVCASGVTN